MTEDYSDEELEEMEQQEADEMAMMEKDAEITRLTAEIAAKDARIAELDSLRDKALAAWCEMTLTCDELRSALAASKAREGEAAGLIKDLSDIVNNSSGVMGWHLNGDEASWGELLDEGHHEIIESFLTRLKERQ